MNFMLSVVPDSFFGVAFGGGGSSSSSCGGGDLGFAVPGFHMIRLLLQGITLSVPSPWSIEEMAKRMIGWSWWEIQHQAGPLQSRVELFRSGFSKIPLHRCLQRCSAAVVETSRKRFCVRSLHHWSNLPHKSEIETLERVRSLSSFCFEAFFSASSPSLVVHSRDLLSVLRSISASRLP